MTSEELKNKLADANDRVQKRINTFTKLCTRSNVDPQPILAELDSYYNTHKKEQTWLRSSDAKAMVTKYTWKPDEYGYTKESDAADNLQKLYELKLIADNWEVKYNKSVNFDNEEKIPVLVDFLNQWKALATSWYKENAEEYLKLKQNQEEAKKEYMEAHKEDIERYGRAYRWENSFYEQYYSDISALTKDIAHLKGHYVGEYYSSDRKYVYESVEIDEEKLDKVLEAEKKAKYKDLVNRITSEVGTIEDVSHLHIAATGQLNGIVIGDKGKASVQTIGAGGYNTNEIVNVKHGQCFHYRTLIHKIKN